MFEEQLAFPTEIATKLFLGSVETLNNAAFMAGVSCVISVMKRPPIISSVDQLTILIDDSATVDIAGHFNEVISFIEKCEENNQTLLIHCEKGMSRSASFIIAWLLHDMHQRGQQADYHAVLQMLIQKRSLVAPNSGFASQLCDYAKKLNESTLDSENLIKNRSF